MLLLIVIDLIVGDMLQWVRVREYNGADLLESGKLTRLSLGSLSLDDDLTLKKGLGQIWNWSRSPNEPKVR